MPSDRSTRRGDPAPYTQKYLKRREAIIGTSARLFNRDGLKGATLAEIAGDVGLLTHSITYYYRRKEDLAAACLLAAIEATKAVVVDAARECRPEDRIRRYVCGYADLLAEIATGARDELVFFNDIRALTGSHARRVFDAYNDLFRSVRSLLPRSLSSSSSESLNSSSSSALILVR
jgi:AcrR family transcriptional regulator